MRGPTVSDASRRASLIAATLLLLAPGAVADGPGFETADPQYIEDTEAGGLGRTAFGRVDGDALLDAVLPNSEDGTASSRLFALIQTPSGGFAPRALLGLRPADFPTGDVALVDLTWDGRSDVVMTANSGAGETVRVYPQRVDGNLETALRVSLNLPGTQAVAGLDVADLDGDGRQELVITTIGDGREEISLVTGSPTGPRVIASRALPAGWSTESPPGFFDLNADGLKDILVGGGGGMVGLMFPELTPRPSLLLSEPIDRFAVADFNADGAADFALARTEVDAPGLALRLSKPGGGFVATTVAAAPDALDVAAGNLDRDSKVDLAVIRSTRYTSLPDGGSGADFSAERVTILSGDGRGGFTRIGGRTNGYDAQSITRPRLIDIDADGDDDLVFGNTESRTIVFQNRSTFSPGQGGPSSGGGGPNGGSGGGPNQTNGGAADTTSPIVSIGIHPKRTLRLGRVLRLTVKCDEVCDFKLTPQLVMRAKGQKVKTSRLGVQRISLAAGAAVPLTVPFGRTRLLLARRALDRGARVSLRLAMVVKDPAGNTTIAKPVVPIGR